MVAHSLQQLSLVGQHGLAELAGGTAHPIRFDVARHKSSALLSAMLQTHHAIVGSVCCLYRVLGVQQMAVRSDAFKEKHSCNKHELCPESVAKPERRM